MFAVETLRRAATPAALAVSAVFAANANAQDSGKQELCVPSDFGSLAEIGSVRTEKCYTTRDLNALMSKTGQKTFYKADWEGFVASDKGLVSNYLHFRCTKNTSGLGFCMVGNKPSGEIMDQWKIKAIFERIYFPQGEEAKTSRVDLYAYFTSRGIRGSSQEYLLMRPVIEGGNGVFVITEGGKTVGKFLIQERPSNVPPSD